MNEESLGRHLQLARQAAGLTQQDLCQKAGLSYSTLTKIERGAIKSPSIFTIQGIAQVLNLSLDDMLGLHGHQAGTSKQGVRFVYFDMNGCLVRFYNKSFGLIAEDAGVTTDVVQNIFWQYNEAINRGDVPLEALNQALTERLNIDVNWNKYYLAAIQATPGVDELVRWIRSKYGLGLLTNTMPGLVEGLLAQGTLPQVEYDVIIDSSVVHTIKPETHIYEIAAERAAVKPQEILFIDDDNGNLAAAGHLGWQTIIFDAYEPEESIAAVRAALAA